ncbi:hypothetical protein V6U90_21070 [Micromonospora sp. CPCC 206060]|uniref:hypothetical protein n=1 Tax=Micromonospora sp. CPCC 206060 TaxID=3122406 RepID=UPI002FEE82AE
MTCPSVEVDRTSSEITLADGRTVRPESTWCATTRPGQSFTVAPGAQLDSWALFPAVPEVGSSFRLSWYDFTDVENLQLR